MRIALYAELYGIYPTADSLYSASALFLLLTLVWRDTAWKNTSLHINSYFQMQGLHQRTVQLHFCQKAFHCHCVLLFALCDVINTFSCFTKWLWCKLCTNNLKHKYYWNSFHCWMFVTKYSSWQKKQSRTKALFLHCQQWMKQRRNGTGWFTSFVVVNRPESHLGLCSRHDLAPKRLESRLSHHLMTWLNLKFSWLKSAACTVTIIV